MTVDIDDLFADYKPTKGDAVDASEDLFAKPKVVVDSKTFDEIDSTTFGDLAKSLSGNSEVIEVDRDDDEEEDVVEEEERIIETIPQSTVERAITIDDEFKSTIATLRPEEYSLLEESIIKDGCRDPLVLWNGVLVDGHNRLEICTQHDIEYKTEDISFVDRRAAVDWIMSNQLARRNLTNDQFTIFLGKLYKSQKKRHGGNLPNNKPGEDCRLKPGMLKEQVITLAQDALNGNTGKKTSAIIGKKFGVSHTTVQRAEKIVDEIDSKPELNERIMHGETIKEARKAIRKKEIAESRKAIADKVQEIEPDDRYNIQCGDIKIYD